MSDDGAYDDARDAFDGDDDGVAGRDLDGAARLGGDDDFDDGEFDASDGYDDDESEGEDLMNDMERCVRASTARRDGGVEREGGEGADGVGTVAV